MHKQYEVDVEKGTDKDTFILYKNNERYIFRTFKGDDRVGIHYYDLDLKQLYHPIAEPHQREWARNFWRRQKECGFETRPLDIERLEFLLRQTI
jgi:hypothetical protein